MKNQVQFQKGYSPTQFFRDYGTEERCRQALFQWRWPEGYVRPKCVLYPAVRERAVSVRSPPSPAFIDRSHDL